MKNRKHHEKVILVERIEGKGKCHIEELKELAKAAGYIVVGYITQKRKEEPRYNIGRGKVEELARKVKELGVGKVIFYNMLKPSQVFNLEEKLGIPVIDRIQLILEIFEKNAGSKEAKLQIELARLKYMLPRVKEWIKRAKLKELPGFSRGPGAYKLDVYYNSIRRRIAKIKDELKKIREQKKRREKYRRRIGLPLIVLTGYTNAGKTTLFNKLCKEFKTVSPIPFSTLTTVTRLIDINGKKALLSDTIGFIEDLPPFLIESFNTTLEEILSSDLILLVIDGTDTLTEIRRKVKASLDILIELGALSKPIIAILNKIDLLSESEIREKVNELKKVEYFKDVVPISALKRINFNILRDTLDKYLPGYEELVIEESDHRIIGQILNLKYIKIRELEYDGRKLLAVEYPTALTYKIMKIIEENNAKIVSPGISG